MDRLNFATRAVSLRRELDSITYSYMSIDEYFPVYLRRIFLWAFIAMRNRIDRCFDITLLISPSFPVLEAMNIH